MNPFQALKNRFRGPDSTELAVSRKDDWSAFVEETLDDAGIVVDALRSPDPVSYRFQCPHCERGLRLPEAALGKRFACAFCTSIYRFELAQQLVTNAAPSPATEIAPTTKSWLPKFRSVTNVAERLQADARVEAAKSAIYSAGSRIAAFGKPLAGIAAGTASVLLPGAGEVLAGRQKWGFCTMAAFFGATAAASATGGLWIALPIAIQVYSAHRAVSQSQSTVDAMDARLQANAAEAQQVAAELAAEAQRLNDEQFEAEMRRREAAELEATTGLQTVRIRLMPLSQQA